MAEPSSSDVHVDAPLGSRSPSKSEGYRCAGCSAAMVSWSEGSLCDDCGDVIRKFNQNHSPEDGKFTTGPGGGTSRSMHPTEESGKDNASRRARLPKITSDSLSESELNDVDNLKSSDAYFFARNKGYTHEDALASSEPRSRGLFQDLFHRLSKESSVPTSLLFKCVSCSTSMADWKHGSTCSSCAVSKAAAQPGAPKPAAGKKPGGAVQDEFPKCPRCGTPTPDGTVCDDCRKSVDREHEGGDLTIAQQRHQAQQAAADAKEEEERRGIRGRARAAMARMLGLDDLAKAAYNSQGNPPFVLKASGQKRFSFAPMYMPGRLDAHGEFVKSADELQEAAWDYVRKSASNRTVYLQHIDKPAGEWVEITSWPYPVEAMMTTPDNGMVRKATLPAGTVYMGVVWEPWAWDLVQKGRLLGFSMGGWAKRVQAELADESVTKNH